MQKEESNLTVGNGLLILGALGRLTISIFIAKVGELRSLGLVLLSLLLGSFGCSL